MSNQIVLDISLGYSKSCVLYEDIELVVELGKIHNIIGENGSGKSTFYKTLTGALSTIKGEVPVEISKNVAIISDYVSLPQELLVKDILSFTTREKMEYMRERYTALYEIMIGFKEKKIKTLSTGQKRMLEIFSVLSTNKSILILDEACNGLDYRNKNYFIENIKQLSSQYGVTIFSTSHNLDDVIDLGGHVYVMDRNSKKIRNYKGEMTVEMLNLYIKSLYGDVENGAII